MSLKKTVAIAAAAGAMAAVAVPALALENEFHGTYSFNTTFSNFQNGTSGDVNPAGKPSKLKMNNYFEQRARLQYIAKASDDLKLVSHFEFDNRFGAGRAAGNGDLDTDFTNFELKHMYLDFNLGKSTNVKTGLMPYKDTIKGLLIDADAPAILVTSKITDKYTLGIGFSRFDDDAAPSVANTGTTRLGDADVDMFILDNTFAFSKDTKAALSYYFIADYAGGETGYANASTPNGSNLLGRNAAKDTIYLNTLALSGETKVGPVALSGFAAMQSGHWKHQNASGNGTSLQLNGWAANAAAKMAVGPGTAKAAFLFTSGDNSTGDAHYKGWVTSSVNTYNEGGMQILARNTAQSPTSTDRYVRRNVTNLALLTMGYDANLTDKVFLNGNVGFGWTPASGEVAKNASDFMGTEVNLEGGYKVNPNLTLKATAGYMILGGLYKQADVTGTKDPENPYTMRLHAQFKF